MIEWRMAKLTKVTTIKNWNSEDTASNFIYNSEQIRESAKFANSWNFDSFSNCKKFWNLIIFQAVNFGKFVNFPVYKIPKIFDSPNFYIWNLENNQIFVEFKKFMNDFCEFNNFKNWKN